MKWMKTFREYVHLHFIFQVTGIETDINDDFRKPDISLTDFLKSKFIIFRLQRFHVLISWTDSTSFYIVNIFCNGCWSHFQCQCNNQCVCMWLCLISVSQNVCPPPVEPSLPDAGPGPVLLLLSDRRFLYIPEQVSGETVWCFARLQQPDSRWVLWERKCKDGASGKDPIIDHYCPFSQLLAITVNCFIIQIIMYSMVYIKSLLWTLWKWNET